MADYDDVPLTAHLVSDGDGRWRLPQKRNEKPDPRRFLAARLIDSTNCTHSLNRPGERCCYCGGQA